MRAEIEIDLPLPAARLTYMLILLPSAVDMVRLLVQTEPGAPVWLRAIAHPALLLAVLSIAATLSHVLYRVSFSAEEIRAAARRRRERGVQRTRVP
jgi:lysylphosphatidylglycerol synthetase-like protein (DUF2156 family)